MFSVKKAIFLFYCIYPQHPVPKNRTACFSEKRHTGFVDSRTEHLEFQENIPDALHGYPPS